MSLLQALSLKLKVKVKYFTQAVHIGLDQASFEVPLIICFSEHSVLFLDIDLNSLLGEVFFAYIDQVAQDPTQPVIRFEFSDRRAKGIPKKMTLILVDKENLLKFLKCCWETDHIWRLSKVASLKVKDENIDLKKYRSKKMIKIEEYLKPQPGCFVYEFKGYKFVVDKVFEEKTPGILVGKVEDENYEVLLDVGKAKALGEDLQDLKDLAEAQVDVMEEFFFCDNRNYYKKNNLAGDLAIWDAWIVVGIAGPGFAVVIVLRRKFIPPMADSSQDIIVKVSGGKYSKFLCETAADSIYSVGINGEIYLNLLKQKSDALMMDEDAMEVYKSKFKIFPDKAYFAYQILIGVLEVLQKQGVEYKKMIQHLKKKPLAKNPDLVVDKKEEPNKILDNFCRSSFLSTAGLGYKYWKKKVYRYVTFCLNGGLSDGKVNLELLLSQISKLKPDKDSEKLKILMNRLLHVHLSLDSTELEDISSISSQMLSTSGFLSSESPNSLYNPSSSWKFNNSQMMAFINSGYLKKEFELIHSPNYIKFLILLLNLKSSSKSLKSCICQACSSLNSSSSDSSMLIPHLIDLYSQSSSSLSSDSSEALISLASKNKENKKLVIQYLDRLTSKLKSKHRNIISNTLTLLISLCSDQSRRKVIQKSSMRLIRSLVIGNQKLPKDLFIISKSLQILSIFVNDFTCSESFALDEEFLQVCFDYLADNDEVNAVVIEFMKILCERNQGAKALVGKKGISKLVDLLKKCRNLECIKLTLALIKQLALNRNDENFANILAKGTKKVLERLLQDSKFNIDEGLVQSIKVLKEILE